MKDREISCHTGTKMSVVITGWTIQCSNADRGRIFISSPTRPRLRGPLNLVQGILYPQLKRELREADPWRPTSAEVSEWRLASAPLYAFMAWTGTTWPLASPKPLCWFMFSGTFPETVCSRHDWCFTALKQCFWNWVPQGGVKDSDKRKCGRVWLVVLSFYERIKFRVTSEANHSVTDSTQSFRRCFKPETSWICRIFGQQLAIDSRYVRRNDQVIDQFEVSRWYFTCNVPEDKQMLVFNCIFDLLCTGMGSSVRSLALLDSVSWNTPRSMALNHHFFFLCTACHRPECRKLQHIWKAKDGAILFSGACLFLSC
jgi:hypothetical protein